MVTCAEDSGLLPCKASFAPPLGSQVTRQIPGSLIRSLTRVKAYSNFITGI